MRSYHSSTPTDWSRCERCTLCTTRRNVVTRRSGLVVPRERIIHLILDTPGPFPPRLLTHFTPSPPLSTSQTPPLVPPPTRLPYILIIGEAPGQAEDNHGVPFWGTSGRFLDILLLYYNTQHFVFTITNTVCCRPPDNRKPSPEEMGACRDHVAELIYDRLPDGILLLGEVAKNYYSEQLKEFHGLPSLELAHPAFIARLSYKHLTLRRQGNLLTDWIKTL